MKSEILVLVVNLMNKIKVMSENLANKIAAGEVVEKCASVVKELVENAIDAQAQEIIIYLKEGGLKEITVIDDGEGMSEQDALLAFFRHATSKIIKDDDLFFIDTLGFRGEALPSIASVANVMLKTCQDEVGTIINIKGGKLVNQGKGDAKKGTTIQVTDLFYNTPARLKYLKNETTELANTLAFIEKMAFAYPAIRFKITNNDKQLLKTTGSNNLLKVIHEIYGANIASKMLEIKNENDDYDILGFIGKPELLKSNRQHITTIVNGRIIKNNDLNRAINDAYYTYKPDNKYPLIILNINTDSTLIDVNIHPTKQDIKMSKMSELCSLITNTIKDSLYHHLLIPQITNQEYMINEPDQAAVTNLTELSLSFGEEPNGLIPNQEIKALVLYPIGVVHGTYIIAENDEGMYLIDQHAAQERINYEKYLKALKNNKITQIAPLLPMTFELNPADYTLISQHLDLFTKMGFKIEEFGPNTYRISEHPTWLKEGYEQESIQKIIDLIIMSGTAFDVVKFNENMAITLACKLSIKGNTSLSLPNMEELLRELVLTDNPYNCPHGRPTIIKYSITELERLFKRIS